MAIGITMVSSASIYFADENYGNPFHFASRQMLFISIGLISMIFFSVIPSDFLFKSDWVFMLISIILLFVMFLPEVGTTVNGSTRWIRVGPINIQPSEICKFSLILYISGYSVRRMSEIDTLRSFLKPLLLLFIIALLIMSQPDLGSTAILCLLVVAILFYALRKSVFGNECGLPTLCRPAVGSLRTPARGHGRLGHFLQRLIGLHYCPLF